MKYLKKATDRLARQLKTIDKDDFHDALVEMLASYSVDPSDVPGLPRMWSVSDEYAFTRRGGPIYASAEPQMPKFYIRNVLRGVRKAAMELLATHLYCHEMFHYLGCRVTERVKLESTNGAGDTFELVRSISGFQLGTRIAGNGRERDAQCIYCGFHFFNEGVTELLAREFFARWWIKRGRVRNVTPAQADRYRQELNNRHGFYPIPVKFVSELLVRFSLTSDEMPKTVLSWLVQAYVAGTDLRTDETWLGYVQRAGLPDSFTSQLENASEDKLEELREDGLVRKFKVNPIFGHAFDDLVVI